MKDNNKYEEGIKLLVEFINDKSRRYTASYDIYNDQLVNVVRFKFIITSIDDITYNHIQCYYETFIKEYIEENAYKMFYNQVLRTLIFSKTTSYTNEGNGSIIRMISTRDIIHDNIINYDEYDTNKTT